MKRLLKWMVYGLLGLLACGLISTIMQEEAVPVDEAETRTVSTPIMRGTEAAVATSYSVLDGAYDGVDGVTEVLLSTAFVREDRWYAALEMIVAPGANTEATADAIRQATYAALGSAFVEISMILDDGIAAIDYTWDNETDTWRVTPLKIPTQTAMVRCAHRAQTCSAMSDCAEAKACLAAGDKHLDRDGDGVPCESLCG